MRLGRTGSDLFTVGRTGHDCSIRYVAYAPDGQVTASTNSPVDVWFLTPDDRDEVNGPGDTKARPCKDHIVALAPLICVVLVICTNGSAMSTTNEGRTLATGHASSRHSGSRVGRRPLLAGGNYHNCEGIAVRSVQARGGPGRQSGPMTTTRFIESVYAHRDHRPRDGLGGWVPVLHFEETLTPMAFASPRKLGKLDHLCRRLAFPIVLRALRLALGGPPAVLRVQRSSASDWRSQLTGRPNCRRCTSSPLRGLDSSHLLRRIVPR